MSSCSGNCSTCGSDCADRKAESLLAALNPKSSVKKVIAVVSGKGGVGKSTVTSMLAVAMARRGKRVAVLDADITGPSAPTAFGVNECQGANEDGLYQIEQRNKFSVGEEIEVMKPNGENILVTVKAIRDEKGAEMESAPHPQQILYIDLGQPLDKYDILRRKED